MKSPYDEEAAPVNVSLVIPGRNCQTTLAACLDAVVPLLERGELAEIIFVDDGSTDRSREVAAQYPVRIIHGSGQGPGAARNLGWRAASGEAIWFIDSDCVAEPAALRRLVALLTEPRVAGVGGSYGNMCPESLTACLIHEEIVARHERMPTEVNYLSTFNVLYRRSVLEELGGFDETRYTVSSEDAQFAFRLIAADYKLRFDAHSRVKHFHPTSFRRYLVTQQRHGFYRVRLYADFPRRVSGDSYTTLADHLQPPLAMLILLLLPFALTPYWCIPLLATLLLVALQLPMAATLFVRTQQARYLAYIPFGFVRAVRRGFGMTVGVLDVAWSKLSGGAQLLWNVATRRTQPQHPA
jgi:glycosyltransferase involved in cell wall biosynthesis